MYKRQALASSNKVIMLQNAIYSVISPEGCATILWRDPKKTLEAAKAMKLSAIDLLDLKVIDEIIEEPVGGAHRDKDLILNNVRNSIRKNLKEFKTMNREDIFINRKNKFLSIGRGKGFMSQSAEKETLTMKKSLFNELNTMIGKNKYIILILLSISLFSIYLLIKFL